MALTVHERLDCIHTTSIFIWLKRKSDIVFMNVQGYQNIILVQF
jgi:hypothetical protein